MFLKLMEGGSGEFSIVEVSSVSFRRLPEPTAVCDEGKATEKSYPLPFPSIVFVLNSDGKTVDKFYNTPDRKTDR